ncbi:CheR family methyltransferase [Flavobacterium sp. FlaQc-47]|uniref:CheR family methyltransferase n=1 Tax=Flavobacterium sp. FlaQc-47 TaxID=3374180 RepID=UPI003757F526
MKLPETKQPEKTKQDFPVVGIGASAGGLDAFKKLLQQIPINSGMAYVIVQHLSPDHSSNLTEILSQHTEIPVHEIVNDINLAPDNIYVIPENNNLIAEDGVLKLHTKTRAERKNATIDIFFDSLAKIHTTFAIGVILSGTAFDGTFGLKKIKELGGATIAQDPETAAFKGMPQSAIDADVADFVLAPEDIAEQLLKIHQSYTANYAYTEEDEIPKSDEETLQQILNLVFLRTGNDFRHYKQPTIRRRIARRMVVVRKESLQDYYNLLRNDKAEQEALFNDFLIPVTYFFRDTKFFDSLPGTIFPQLIQNTVNNNLRVWVPGCATGEEAYSLAISIHEYLVEKNNKDIKVQIFASDLSEKCITQARTAIYSAQDIQHVSPSRLQNYFTKRDGHYHINKVIRDMCIFAVHNFIKDPPFARMDLVSCRNVLIYFDPFLQNKVLGSFHYSLKEKGILFLGKSETIVTAPNLFDPLGKQIKIYTRKFAAARYVPEAFKPANINSRERSELQNKKMPETDFRKIATDILFLKYTPASVIINDHLEIVHFHGDTSSFLLPSPGKPNFNILKMAREGISFELRNAILKVKKDNKNVIKDNITVNDQSYLASFEVVSIPNDDEHLMVLFYKKPLPDVDQDLKLKRKKTDQLRIEELEKELAQLREDIKRVTEEQQTAFEELQTTNEELLSSSEELQAMNEELETSTEELQSNNEELMCVNDELLDRQEQLISVRNYSESIFKTIREPLLIIDSDFFVKSANPAFYKYFETTEKETEGYSLFEIGDCQWEIPEFRELITKMKGEKTSIEGLKVDTTCKGIGKKIMIVNARKIIDAKPAGMILLAIEDITEIIAANHLLTIKNTELEMHNEQLETFSAAASHDLQEPLRKIHMFCKRIIENETDNISETSKHNLERMLFAVINMSQLITDLINYSRINLIEKEFKKTDLNLLLKKTIGEIKETIVEKNAVITVSPFPQLKVIPHQMQQLFNNLILNAIKYTREGVIPEIKIETQQPSQDEIIEVGGNKDLNYVKICIIDNGIGFDQQYASKIFDPFYRLHNNDKYHGSGLGLTLVKKIVLNHEGFIKVESRINEGTSFYIYLPV